MKKNSKKDIIVCSTSYFEYDRRIMRILSTLQENGYAINWLSRSYNDKSEVSLNINHHTIKAFFKKGILFYAEFNVRVFFKILFSNERLVYAIDADTVLAAYLGAVIRNKKIVFDAHEIFHEVPELTNKPFKKYIWKTLSSIFYPKIEHKFTVNDSLKNVFLDQFNTEFSVIRNVPFLNDAVQDLPLLEHKELVYLGVLNKGRGVELAIQALETLTDYTLVLIGDGDISDELKNLASKLNVDERVRFLGYQSPEKIPQILSKASIGLNMLDPTSDNYKYSLANKFFDYIHAALPSVNMRFPEYESINMTTEVSVLAGEYNTDALINCITFLQDNYTYTTLQNNCIKAKSHYNWSVESQKLLQIFNKALLD